MAGYGLLTDLAGLKLATGHGLDAWFAWPLAVTACGIVIASIATTRRMPVESRSAVYRFLGFGLLLMGAALLLLR